jgi:hypothetical protein
MLLLVLGCVFWDDPPPVRQPPPPVQSDALPAAPTQPSAPAASDKARPDWVAGTAYAPQAPTSIRLSAQPATGEVKGLVTCGVEADHQDPKGLFGKFRDPDLTVELLLGVAEIKAHGPEDSRTMRVSAPLIHLAGGEVVKVTVYDRDVFKTQHIETLTGTYDGAFPFSLTGTTSNATCELVPWAVVESMAAPLIAEAHAGLEIWETSLAPDLQAYDLGAPSGRPLEAMIESAALVGWADERVQHVLAEHDILISAYEADLSAQLKAAQADRAQYGTLLLDQPRLLCGGAGASYTTMPGSCAVAIEVAGNGSLSFPVTDLAVVWATGVANLDLAGTGLDEDYVSSPTASIEGNATVVLVSMQSVGDGDVWLRVGAPGSFHYVPVSR